jgi:hypothetical protein
MDTPSVRPVGTVPRIQRSIFAPARPGMILLSVTFTSSGGCCRIPPGVSIPPRDHWRNAQCQLLS